MDQETQNRIRAAGAVQAVVASGLFKIEEWRMASLYVVSLTAYVAKRITGGQTTKKGVAKPIPPAIPNSLKERPSGK